MKKACARVIENQQQTCTNPNPSNLPSSPKNGNGYSNHHHGICYFRMDGLAPPALFDKSGCYHTHTHTQDPAVDDVMPLEKVGRP
jgi:hypothetical protein